APFFPAALALFPLPFACLVVMVPSPAPAAPCLQGERAGPACAGRGAPSGRRRPPARTTTGDRFFSPPPPAASAPLSRRGAPALPTRRDATRPRRVGAGRRAPFGRPCRTVRRESEQRSGWYVPCSRRGRAWGRLTRERSHGRGRAVTPRH